MDEDPKPGSPCNPVIYQRVGELMTVRTVIGLMQMQMQMHDKWIFDYS